MKSENEILNPATITTLRKEDVETIVTSDALTLNWEGVLARKLSVPKGPMQEAIQCLLNDLRENPAIHAVSRPDTPHAAKIEAALANIKVRREPVPPLWVPYLEACANWRSRQSAPAKPADPLKAATAEDSQAAAVAAALKRAEAKVAAERKKAEDAAKAAEALAALSPNAKKHADERAEREAERAQMAEKIRPYALGQACVDRNSRPTGLSVSETEGVGLSFPQDIAGSIPEGYEPSELAVPCAFCGTEHKLGDSFSFTVHKNDGEKRVTVFRAQLLWLAARTENGADEYRYAGGDKAGSPKKLPVLACSDCAKLARELGRAENLPYELMPNSSSALELVARAHLKAQAEKADERGTRATLVAKFGDMAAAKGERRDRKTRRNSAE